MKNTRMNTNRTMPRGVLAIAVTFAVAATTPACELIVDFDRSKILVADASSLPDATIADGSLSDATGDDGSVGTDGGATPDATASQDGSTSDASADAAATDAAPDATAPTDAATDANMTAVDAGLDAATSADAADGG